MISFEYILEVIVKYGYARSRSQWETGNRLLEKNEIRISNLLWNLAEVLNKEVCWTLLYMLTPDCKCSSLEHKI